MQASGFDLIYIFISNIMLSGHNLDFLYENLDTIEGYNG